jgi:hypothetical protein
MFRVLVSLALFCCVGAIIAANWAHERNKRLSGDKMATGDPIQDAFVQAVDHGRDTLRVLGRGPIGRGQTPLKELTDNGLHTIVWDLERITAAVQREIDTRLEGPVDTA